MTLNLENNILEQAAMLDEKKWTHLQIETCLSVANAKLYAFEAEAARVAEWVRLGFLTRSAAADNLHVTATYNQLYFEYGSDRIQKIMAEALESRAA